MPQSTLKFKPSELPNPLLLTAPENLEYMEKMENEAAAKKKGKVPTKAPTVSRRDICALFIVAHSLLIQTRKRKADENDDPAPAAENASGPSKKKAKAATEKATKAGNLFDISLPGEDEGKVEIYDSCDELRRKITVHLSVSGQTKAAFLRDIIKAANSDAYPLKIQGKQLADFLALRGALGGNSSKVCYASYVYFEKKRITEGEKKTKHRLGMEEAWGTEGGLPREMRRGGYWCRAGEEPVEDKYGKVKIHTRGIQEKSPRPRQNVCWWQCDNRTSETSGRRNVRTRSERCARLYITSVG